jgi:hypothetical protein
VHSDWNERTVEAVATPRSSEAAGPAARNMSPADSAINESLVILALPAMLPSPMKQH